MNMEFIGRQGLGYHRNNEGQDNHHQCVQTGIIFLTPLQNILHLNFSYPSSEVIRRKKFRKNAVITMQTLSNLCD